METTVKVLKFVLRAIGWLLVASLRALGIMFSLLGGASSYSHGTTLMQSAELQHWQRDRMQPERLSRR